MNKSGVGVEIHLPPIASNQSCSYLASWPLVTCVTIVYFCELRVPAFRRLRAASYAHVKSSKLPPSTFPSEALLTVGLDLSGELYAQSNARRKAFSTPAGQNSGAQKVATRTASTPERPELKSCNENLRRTGTPATADFHPSCTGATERRNSRRLLDAAPLRVANLPAGIVMVAAAAANPITGLRRHTRAPSVVATLAGAVVVVAAQVAIPITFLPSALERLAGIAAGAKHGPRPGRTI